MVKLSKLVSLIVLSMSLSSVANAAWQPAKEVECKRKTIDSSITMNDVTMMKSSNTRSACFGSDNPVCDLRFYDIYVPAFVHDDSGAPGVEKNWSPSTVKGNIKGILNNLAYIKGVGVNAIILSPIFKTVTNEFQGEEHLKHDGTGSYVSNYFEIDPRFGTLDELKELVDRAHRMGLKVVFDIALGKVKNNISVFSPNDNRLILNQNCRSIKGYFDKTTVTGTSCINSERSVDYLKDVVSYWINELKIDGYRFIDAYQIETKVWKELREAIKVESAKETNMYKQGSKSVNPLGLTIADMVTDQPKDIESNAFSSNSVEMAMNYPAKNAILRVLASDGDSFSKKSCSQPTRIFNDDMYAKMAGYSRKGIPVNFISSANGIRFGDLLQRAKYEKDGDLDASYYNAHKAALVFLTSMSGPISLMYGDEIGSELEDFVSSPSNCDRTNQCDDHVSRTSGKINGFSDFEQDLKQHVFKYLKLRDEHLSLSRGERIHVFSDESLYLDIKQYKKDRVLVILNSSEKARKVSFEPSLWKALKYESCGLIDLDDYKKVSKSSLEIPSVSTKMYRLDCIK